MLMAGAAVGSLNRMEYRLVVAIGMQYCRRRGIEPNDGLTQAAAVAAQTKPSVEVLLAACGYAFKIWCRIMYFFIGLLVAYGLAFDEFFYSRGNFASEIIIAILTGLPIGAIVEATVIKVRLNFLGWSDAARFGVPHLPKRASPKVYDFWIAAFVTVVATLALLFGRV